MESERREALAAALFATARDPENPDRPFPAVRAGGVGIVLNALEPLLAEWSAQDRAEIVARVADDLLTDWGTELGRDDVMGVHDWLLTYAALAPSTPRRAEPGVQGGDGEGVAADDEDYGDGCDCTELCAMGPTCPGGMLAGLDGAGCWRTKPEHELIGSVCSCLDWQAQCGNDVAGQWAEHVHQATTTPSSGTSPRESE